MKTKEYAPTSVYVAGKCKRCGKYYELPRQEWEAASYFTLRDDGTFSLVILCSNSVLCGERAGT